MPKESGRFGTEWKTSATDLADDVNLLGENMNVIKIIEV
jgi:hypothetical protein